jgi:hypothetical protein
VIAARVAELAASDLAPASRSPYGNQLVPLVGIPAWLVTRCRCGTDYRWFAGDLCVNGPFKSLGSGQKPHRPVQARRVRCSVHNQKVQTTTTCPVSATPPERS